MKMIVTTVAVLLMTVSVAVAQNAEATANSGSQSGAASFSRSEGGGGGAGGAAQQTQGQVLYIDQRAPGEQTLTTNNNTRVSGTTTLNTNTRVSGTTTENVRQSGTVRNEFAPAVSAPAMGSGHPCGMGNSLGISIIGGGATGGITRVDDACLLGQMGYRRAATAMIAARNPAACAALVATGEISPASNCGDGARVGGGIMRGGSSSGPLRAGAGAGEPAGAVARPVSAGNIAPVLAVASQRNAVCRIKEGTTRVIQTSATTEQGRMACAVSLGLN